MKNISIFQLVVLGIFFLSVGAGVIVVSIYSSRGGAARAKPVSVVVWGTLAADEVQTVVGKKSSGSMKIAYIQKNESTFDFDLAEAIATGRGPDIVLLRQDSLVANLAKIWSISYEDYPARDFQNNFIEEGELFLSDQSIFGIPFVIDPLVMYWNRDLLSRVALANTPRYWDEMQSFAERLTERDADGTIVKSALALGGYDNVKNAKEILSALFIQSGSEITTWNKRFSSVEVSFSQSPRPASVLSFFMQFSDARKSVQSWNQALPDSESMFLGNRLALYFGFASEARNLKERSPNLNFDVAPLPQSRNSGTQATFGRLYALAVLKTSKDKPGSVEAIKVLTSKDASAAVAKAMRLPPVRRDVTASADDAHQAVFFPSALISRGWLDPRRNDTDFIFKDMIDSVVSGFSTAEEAVGKAQTQLRRIAQSI